MFKKLTEWNICATWFGSILSQLRNEISVLDLFGEESVVFHRYDICVYFIQVYIPNHTTPHHTHHNTPHHTTPHHTLPHHVPRYHHTTPHAIPAHHTTPHATPHHTTPHQYPIPHHTTKYHTMPYAAERAERAPNKYSKICTNLILWKTTLCSPNRSRTEISLRNSDRIDPNHVARLFHSAKHTQIQWYDRFWQIWRRLRPSQIWTHVSKS